LAKSLVKRLTETEVSYYGTIDDIQVRVRPDGIKDNDYIIDIKTTMIIEILFNFFYCFLFFFFNNYVSQSRSVMKFE